MATLSRSSVSADNSCLFTAVARLCEGVEAEIALKTAGRRLRGVCAEAVLADPDPTTRAVLLGHDSVDAYSAWIRNDHHWGGEPEILMLAQHFSVEINVASCESLSFLRYAPESPRGRVYLLYTGQHYDPLVGTDGTLVLPCGDGPEGAASTATLEASALEICRTHIADARRRALEKRVKRLKCLGCGAILNDAAAFQVSPARPVLAHSRASATHCLSRMPACAPMPSRPIP